MVHFLLNCRRKSQGLSPNVSDSKLIIFFYFSLNLYLFLVLWVLVSVCVLIEPFELYCNGFAEIILCV